jgi:hypothetical protein
MIEAVPEGRRFPYWFDGNSLRPACTNLETQKFHRAGSSGGALVRRLERIWSHQASCLMLLTGKAGHKPGTRICVSSCSKRGGDSCWNVEDGISRNSTTLAPRPDHGTQPVSNGLCKTTFPMIRSEMSKPPALKTPNSIAGNDQRANASALPGADGKWHASAFQLACQMIPREL